MLRSRVTPSTRGTLDFRRWLAVGVTALFTAAVAGCGSQSATSSSPVLTTVPAPTTTIAPANVSISAEAIVPAVNVYETPGAPQPVHTLANPNAHGGPLVFLFNEEGGPDWPDWINVYLPVRPNGSTGWIRSSDVRLAQTDFSVVVELGAHRLTVWQGDAVFHQEPVGIGTGNTPTPGGVYYTTFLAKTDAEQARKYGPFAYILSGFSEVYLDFDGGNGEVGIHGTNNPNDLGKDVSNGCIRMSNEGITKLAGVLPLGVPVEIVP